MEPELLFDHLSEHHERINYARAYEILFGRFARWEQRMAQDVVEVALRTNPRPIAGANIRLDALIVNKDSGRPSAKHFESKSYSEQQWFGSFGSWPLCGHDDSFFTNNRLRASPHPAPPIPELGSPLLSPGDQVIHREFGEGWVLSVEHGSDEWFAKVEFLSAGTREIGCSFLKLSRKASAFSLEGSDSVVLTPPLSKEPVPPMKKRWWRILLAHVRNVFGK